MRILTFPPKQWVKKWRKMGVNASPAQLPISPSLLTLLSYIYISFSFCHWCHIYTQPQIPQCMDVAPGCIFNCSPLTLSFEKPCTYTHAVHPTSSPISLTYFSLSCSCRNHKSQSACPQFSFQGKNWSGRRIIFLLAFEFCQNRVSDVSGQQLIATQTEEAL